jgi:hypothetical protein
MRYIALILSGLSHERSNLVDIAGVNLLTMQSDFSANKANNKYMCEL